MSKYKSDRKNVPVAQGEIYSLYIDGITQEGQGVGRIDNFAVFVDGVLKGEQCKVKIIKVSARYAVGELLEIIHKSPEWETPFCGVFPECGGCSLQHMSYEAQLKHKKDVVADALQRIGGLDRGFIIHDTIGMDKPFFYRNKAQYPVGTLDGKIVTGFYAKGSHNIVPSDECGIQHPLSEKLRKRIELFMEREGLSAYDEKNHTGLVRHIVTRAAVRTGELMAIIVLNILHLHDCPHTFNNLQKLHDCPRSLGEALADFIDEEVPECTSIYLNFNKERTNVILGNENRLIYGKETITEYIGDLAFEISPHSFFQVNPLQTEKLYAKTLEYAALTGRENVFDLYCGIGTITLFLAQKAGHVYGVESVEPAVENARKNAARNRISNASFICGQAETVIPRMYAEGHRADVVVVDPPRKGCDQKLLDTLVKMSPSRIVYVSCNPATLARDIKFLTANGFRLAEVQPVDMFPWTGNVECVAKVEKE